VKSQEKRKIGEYDGYEYPLIGKDTPEIRANAEKGMIEAKELAERLKEKYQK